MEPNCVVEAIKQSGVLEYINKNPMVLSNWFRNRARFVVFDDEGRFDGIMRYTMRHIPVVSDGMVSCLDIVQFQLCNKEDRRKGWASAALRFLCENARVDYLFFEALLTEEAHAVMKHIGAQQIREYDYILPTNFKK